MRQLEELQLCIREEEMWYTVRTRSGIIQADSEKLQMECNVVLCSAQKDLNCADIFGAILGRTAVLCLGLILSLE